MLEGTQQFAMAYMDDVFSRTWDDVFSRTWDDVFSRTWDDVFSRTWDDVFSRTWDDVFSRTWDECMQHLTEVVERMKGHGLTIKSKKWRLGMMSCSFLEHTFGQGRVLLDAAKMGVAAFQQPETKKAVHT